MDYEIIATGSSGNCVIVDGAIAIDMGVPYKSIAGCMGTLQLVLLSHQHGDHFRKSTVRRLAQERPALRIGCCWWMVPDILICGANKSQVDVYELNQTYTYGNITVRPEPLVHNVPNCGYHITTSNGEKLFFATDCNTLEGVSAPGYDLYLIEANYAEDEIVERIQRKQEIGKYVHEWDVIKNHLSKEKAEDWLYRNMGQDSRYRFLHRHEEQEQSN